MRGSPEGMWGAGGSGPEGGDRASGRGGFGQGVGPPAFPWKRRGVSAEARPRPRSGYRSPIAPPWTTHAPFSCSSDFLIRSSARSFPARPPFPTSCAFPSDEMADRAISTPLKIGRLGLASPTRFLEWAVAETRGARLRPSRP